jgi:translocator protein
VRATAHPPGRPQRRYRWWHAAAVGAVANLASAAPAGYNGEQDYFVQLNTPPGSPPGWLFAPAWAVNNLLTLRSNLRVANLAPQTPGRHEVLISEAATWTLFASFPGLGGSVADPFPAL